MVDVCMYYAVSIVAAMCLWWFYKSWFCGVVDLLIRVVLIFFFAVCVLCELCAVI